MDRPGPRRGFHLIDAAALVVGYALASLWVRAFYPKDGGLQPAVALAFSLVYLWSGLAMTGPIVLAIDRRRPVEPLPGGATPPGPIPRTRAENAWLLIGAYWIILTLVVLPMRMRVYRISDVAAISIVPLLGAVGMWRFSPRADSAEPAGTRWTHAAAVTLLASWPVAWFAFILLAKALS